MKENGVEKLREETGHSACTFQRSFEAFSGCREWLEIVCNDCGEKAARLVLIQGLSAAYTYNTEEDMHDPDVQEIIRDMRKTFCKELDWNRIWF